MITFDLVSAKNAVNSFTHKNHWAKKNTKTLTQTLNSIALKTKNNLPFTLLKKGKSSEGDDFINSYNKKPTSKWVEKMIYPTKFMSNSYLAWDLKFTLNSGIQVGAFCGDIINKNDAQNYAKQFVDKFMSKEGGTWIDDGGLSAAIKESTEGKKLIADITTGFKKNMLLFHGDFTKCSLIGSNIKSPSFSWSSSPTLKILIGGTQELTVIITYMSYNIKNCTWKARIDVEIRDDFGVTESDITNASPSAKLGMGGLLDMWVLQKQRGQQAFTSVFNFSFMCNGDY